MIKRSSGIKLSSSVTHTKERRSDAATPNGITDAAVQTVADYAGATSQAQTNNSDKQIALLHKKLPARA
jgi:hypothetical protein